MLFSDWSSYVFSADRHHLRIEAIGSCDHERVLGVWADSGRGDIGDPSPERTAHPENALVNQIGNAVRDIAHCLRAAIEKLGQQRFLPGHIVQLELGAITAIRRSEERRAGKACVRTCRSRWSPSH